MTTVTIVQLYPNELGVAGDRGNVLALEARIATIGVDVSVVQYSRGDSLPDRADIVVVGNGPLSAMRTIESDLRGIAPQLSAWASDGVPFFAYGAGAELLGHSVALLDGTTLEGLGLLPFRARRVLERKVGYILTDTEWGGLVGFEDNASVWTLDDGAAPLGTLTAGGGNGDGREGVVSGNLIGTQVGGPVLPLNPLLTAVLVSMVAGRHGLSTDREADAATSALDDYASRAREVIVSNASHVFSRI